MSALQWEWPSTHHGVGAASVDLNKRKGQGEGDGLGPDRVSLGASFPKGRGYHAVARLIRKHSRGSLTYQPSKHQLATFRKMKFNASIVTIKARTTEPSTALRR